MLIDTNDLDKGLPLPAYDVCIVGSGPAGLTVAQELAANDLRICILESGQANRTEHANQLKRVLSEGQILIKDESRERMIGGTSSTWDGLSAPLEPIDILPRPWVPLSGWPLCYDELQQYYLEAAVRYGFPHPSLFGEGLARIKTEGDYHFSWRTLTERAILAPLAPQRFGSALPRLVESSAIDLYTDASVTELLGDPGRSLIKACRATTREMNSLMFRASIFVLAAGGIENARLLLNSSDLCSGGLGNEHDQVGRYFMNHPKNPDGTVSIDVDVRHMPAYFGCLHRGYAGYLALRLDDRTQQQLGVLNSYVRLEPIYGWSDTPAVQLLLNYVKSTPWLWERLRQHKQKTSAALRDYAETGDDPDPKVSGAVPSLARLAAAVLLEPGPVSHYLFSRIFDRWHRPKVKAVRLRNFMEMEPHTENRVVLCRERDCYGTRLPLVRHSPTHLDRRSLRELHRTLAKELLEHGFGTLASGLADADPWPINMDASHHLGATRMGGNPRTSVVNSDGRLHGVPNVYLAGGSVFPTSGYANPTFTIVALAIRLARHLRAALASRTYTLSSAAAPLTHDIETSISRRAP